MGRLSPRASWRACTWIPLLLLSGCGMVRHAAIGTMVPVFERTVEEVYRDQDVETVAAGMPGNLLLLRGLCASEPGRRDLWTLTTQLYFYYGIGFVEDEDPEHAERVYAQGFALGRASLERTGWFEPEGDLEAYRRGLKKAGEDDVPSLFWTVANWAAWIRMNLEKPEVLAQLPAAEAALDRVLELDPGFLHGMPHALLGTLQASKPVLAGGDPVKAKEHLDEAMRLSGRRFLIYQVLYAQYVCRQTLDEEGFDAALREVLDAPADIDPDYRLLNEVARRKAVRLREHKDELF